MEIFSFFTAVKRLGIRVNLVLVTLPVTLNSRDAVLNQIHRLQQVTERTVGQFVNEILLGIFLSVDESYLNALPCMNEDFYGTKRKGDPV